MHSTSMTDHGTLSKPINVVSADGCSILEGVKVFQYVPLVSPVGA